MSCIPTSRTCRKIENTSLSLVIRRTILGSRSESLPVGKTVKLAKVNVKPDPEWKEKMDFRPGGFCGHMANQSEQTWLFDSIDETNLVSVRKNKKKRLGLPSPSFVEDRRGRVL